MDLAEEVVVNSCHMSVEGGVRLEREMQVAVRLKARWRRLARDEQTRASPGNKAGEVEFPADLGLEFQLLVAA